MTTIQIFRKMFDYLVSNRLIPNQTALARAAGLNEVSVSRILNDARRERRDADGRLNTG